jgi:hypothetical protein
MLKSEQNSIQVTSDEFNVIEAKSHILTGEVAHHVIEAVVARCAVKIPGNPIEGCLAFNHKNEILKDSLEGEFEYAATTLSKLWLKHLKRLNEDYTKETNVLCNILPLNLSKVNQKRGNLSSCQSEIEYKKVAVQFSNCIQDLGSNWNEFGNPVSSIKLNQNQKVTQAFEQDYAILNVDGNNTVTSVDVDVDVDVNLDTINGNDKETAVDNTNGNISCIVDISEQSKQAVPINPVVDIICGGEPLCKERIQELAFPFQGMKLYIYFENVWKLCRVAQLIYHKKQHTQRNHMKTLKNVMIRLYSDGREITIEWPSMLLRSCELTLQKENVLPALNVPINANKNEKNQTQKESRSSLKDKKQKQQSLLSLLAEADSEEDSEVSNDENKSDSDEEEITQQIFLRNLNVMSNHKIWDTEGNNDNKDNKGYDSDDSDDSDHTDDTDDSDDFNGPEENGVFFERQFIVNYKKQYQMQSILRNMLDIDKNTLAKITKNSNSKFNNEMNNEIDAIYKHGKLNRNDIQILKERCKEAELYWQSMKNVLPRVQILDDENSLIRDTADTKRNGSFVREDGCLKSEYYNNNNINKNKNKNNTTNKNSRSLLQETNNLVDMDIKRTSHESIPTLHAVCSKRVHIRTEATKNTTSLYGTTFNLTNVFLDNSQDLDKDIKTNSNKNDIEVQQKKQKCRLYPEIKVKLDAFSCFGNTMEVDRIMKMNESKSSKKNNLV